MCHSFHWTTTSLRCVWCTLERWRCSVRSARYVRGLDPSVGTPLTPWHKQHSADYDAESQRYRPESALVVRFFSTKTLRFLRAISCEQVQYLEEVDACFQPCRMWVLNSKRILCYSSADDVRPLLCDLEEHRSGLMEPAFCMLKRGDAASAAHYVKGFLGLNVNQRNLYTFDSLLFAALKLPLVYASTIQPLLDAGADVKARDSMGRTPLMVACALLLVDCVRLLLDKGSDPLALCPSGRNAAFYVGRCHFYLFHDRDRWQASHILRLLYEAGTPMHQRDAQGSVPFLQRPLLMHLECVTLFASWPGFDAHVVDTSNGYTALHYVVHYCGRATFTEAQRVMRVLIHTHRLSITTRSKDCLSPLMLAANAPNHEHVRLLLEWSRTLDSGLSAKAPLLMSPDLACEERFRDVLLASRQIVPKIDTV
jgi:ankyrin repeat protein